MTATELEALLRKYRTTEVNRNAAHTAAMENVTAHVVTIVNSNNVVFSPEEYAELRALCLRASDRLTVELEQLAVTIGITPDQPRRRS